MAKLFGTDGIRGIANQELTPKLAFQIGRISGYVLAKRRGSKILIGKDTRLSGDMLESALVAGVCSVGAEAILLGVAPTSAVSHLVKSNNLAAGVVISASHNSYEHNGIKLFGSDGCKLSDAIEQQIEDMILSNPQYIKNSINNDIGKVSHAGVLLNEYVDHAISSIGCGNYEFKVALDCANGASFSVAPQIFNKIGAKVFVINDKPDGVNINKACGSTDLTKIAEFVVRTKSDIGFAFDGDADRVLAIDHNGNCVDGDKIMLICALDLKRRNKLVHNTIVTTVMSNLGMTIAAKEHQIDLIQTKVGDKYVLEEMQNGGYVLGGEQSGHIIMLEHSTTGDGIITALHLLSIMKRSGKSLSELASVMNVLPQVLINVKVDNNLKYNYLKNTDICNAISRIEAQLKGRVLVRASGTEPIIRIMIEGADRELITRHAKELSDLIIENC